ncbi:prenyl protein peptidase [Vigna unguiculata]|uniref:Prenyl protein peptidase n=1 Tax=Vigna unguiculata TaxID=3917 RepID=A0A4D6MJZ2_VIGUN|nr:prenyl protein peptidase [Vigna unguiculata]
MASNREREESLTFTIPSSSSHSSPITVSDQLDSYLADPRSASGSFQNDGLLSSADAAADPDFGFSRPDFRQSPLAGTVEFYQRHVFLCYKNPRVWPPRIEAAEFDRLPRLLHAAVVARKPHMKKETRLTICEGHDGTETSNGDVLIFPDMVRYRRLTHFDVETFVEEVLVKDGEWLPGTPEALRGSFVFVCSHGSRDRRCGVCGPVLVSRFREEIELHGLQGKVFVSPCSHIGGSQYAGNVIVFGPSMNGEVTGHWYGYVTPDDVPLLLQHHIMKGEVLDSLWRGQMGFSVDEQLSKQEQRLLLNGLRNLDESTEVSRSQENFVSCYQSNASCCQSNAGCCQSNGDSSFHQNHVSVENRLDPDVIEAEAKLSADNQNNESVFSRMNSGKGASRKFPSVTTWLDGWEQEDTYAALAVVCAAVSVAIAYNCYRQLR